MQHEVSVTLALTPLTIEVAVSALPTAAGSTGRVTSVAHFVAPHWGRIADRLAPLIDRDGGDPGTAPAALICVPDSGAAVELADALRAARPGIARILPVTDALRASRVLKTCGAPIVIVTPSDAERMLSASALPLDGVQVVALVGAEEYDADQLATVMTSVPKDARRVLVASEATPVVEVLLERYFHKAHRLADDASSETTPAPVQYLCVRGSGAATLVPSLLDDLDPPSAVVVTADAAAVRSALAAHGYPADASIVQVSDGAAPQNVALVVFAGLPTPAAFETAMSSQPGRAVALIAPRQLGALRRLAGGASVTPFTTRRATSAARAQEERLRAELRAVLIGSYPAREIVSLEPLLSEYDGAELAGAALRLLEAARAATPAPAQAAAAAPSISDRAPRSAPRSAPRADRSDRPARPRDDFPLRDPREAAKPRFVDRTVRRERDDRPPRRAAGAGDRDERAPRRSFGDKPRAYGDKPRAHGDKPRTYGDKPRAFGDKPRTFGDKPRGGFGDKRTGGFRDKPRGSGPRKPRDDR
ncbi:MAG: DEAD/DEAH box helicase family protein [Gemmatimonadetes bacterium]|nr:DEAD/DEAH box helicase family protein [Gemmatimonadota bacterium]